MFSRTKTFIQVWNELRVSKWRQNFHFWVNYPYLVLWSRVTRKLWQPLLYWNAEGCTSYVCYISISKVLIYTILYVGYWSKDTVLLCFNYWGYGRSPNIWLHPSTRHCKAMIDNMVHNSYMRLCTLPCILTPLLPLSCWPGLFPGCSSIVRLCNSCVVKCQTGNNYIQSVYI